MNFSASDNADLTALRRCARDIAALAALPAIWVSSDFKRGLQNLADVLAAALRARVVYVRIDRPGMQLAEVVSTDSLQAISTASGPIARELAAFIDTNQPRELRILPSLGGEGPFRLATSEITAAGGMRGFILAASAQADFPRDTDKLLLSTGAGQIAILVQRSNQENEMALRSAEVDRINRALLDAKQRLDATLTAAEIGTWTWDVQADRVVGDQNLARLFGMSIAEAQGAPVDVFVDRVHPDDRPALTQAIKHALAAGGNFSAEYRVASAEGIRWVIARGRVELDASGRAVQFPGVLLDITARKQAENELLFARDAAEAANRAKDRFLAVLSHELRTPLSPILTMVSGLAEDPALPAIFRPTVAMIRRNIELETQLIDDLLDVSRVANGKLRLHLQPIHVHEMLDFALETCRGDFVAKQIQVDRQLAAAHDVVIGDPARLQQVFWNLLRNAAKFTPAPGRVWIVTSCPEAGRIAVQIGDTGVGIPEEALRRIFLPFEQGETSVTRQFGGLGLGLAICKAVVETHGGSIRAASEGVGRGATFTVELTTVAAIAPIAPVVVAATPSAAIGRNRILLVEDHADTAKSLAWILGKSGYEVTTAFTAASALEAASQQEFDLMASDLGLPDMDGCQLMREMAFRYGLTGIALSGYGMDDDVSRAREAGFVAHLVKPVNVVRLRKVLQEILAAPVESQKNLLRSDSPSADLVTE